MTAFTAVYNADGGLKGELTYVVGHLLGHAHCALCDITHSSVRRKPEWDRMAATIGVPIHLVHANEASSEVSEAAEGQYPAVVAHGPGRDPVVVLTPAQLDDCAGSVDAFHALLEQRIEALELVLTTSAAEAEHVHYRRWPWAVAALAAVGVFGFLGFTRWDDGRQSEVLAASADRAMVAVQSTELRIGDLIDRVGPTLARKASTPEAKAEAKSLLEGVAGESAATVRGARDEFADRTADLSGKFAAARDVQLRFLDAQAEWLASISRSAWAAAEPRPQVRDLRQEATAAIAELR